MSEAEFEVVFCDVPARFMPGGVPSGRLSSYDLDEVLDVPVEGPSLSELGRMILSSGSKLYRVVPVVQLAIVETTAAAQGLSATVCGGCGSLIAVDKDDGEGMRRKMDEHISLHGGFSFFFDA